MSHRSHRIAAAAFALTAGLADAAAAGPPDFAATVLAAHNAARRAVGVQPLIWSDRLATQARPWAEHLAGIGRLEHSPREARAGAGKNLWMGSHGGYAAAEMVDGWIAERSDFRPGLFPAVAADGDWRHVGHYTQMIWRDTTTIGCALARGAAWDVLVCRYAPAGNVEGEAVP